MATLSPSDINTAVTLRNPQGRGAIVLVCEHASAHIPAALNDLGLAPADRDSHAAWDPGALAMAKHLSDMFDAPLIAGAVSRLVYDCNRPPEAPSAMPEKTELIDIPGNRDLTAADRAARTDLIYVPFCAAVSGVLADRAARGLATTLVTIHSFTPVYFGEPRAVEIGLLHDSDSRMVDAMLAHADAAAPRVLRRNEPYGPDDGVAHSLQIHGQDNGLANVMIEVRNDLIQTPADCAALAQELRDLLRPALADLDTQHTGKTQHG